MTSRTVRRRRIHYDDIDGRVDHHTDIPRSDSLSQPLLGNYGHSDDRDDGSQETLDDKKEICHWTLHFRHLIAQWAQWLGNFSYNFEIQANVIVGSGSFIGKLMMLPYQNGHDGVTSSVYLSPLQEERLRILKQRLKVPYDGCSGEHQDALKELWKLSYPDRELPPLKSNLWKEMGWQGSDPSTDFRGGGFISLENLIFFAKNYPNSFQKLLLKQEGKRSEWEYPFAVAGVNLSFMLAQMLDLQSEIPTSAAGINFLRLLGQDEMAFDNLYCIAFRMMDAQWLAKRASYMEFNEVMKSTRAQLERELALEDVNDIKDLPAYNMLC